MSLIQNNRREEASIRIEVSRQEDLNEVETALCSLIGEMLSALLTYKDDTLVNLCGNMLSQVGDRLNAAMNMQVMMGLDKQHAASHKVNLKGKKENKEDK